MSKEIKHFHYSECKSTQDLLSDFIKDNPNDDYVLFSTLFQTLGRGRQGNKWSSLENSLAMSFIIKPNETLSLTSLELGILLCRFFEKYNLQLKWPNDLITSDGYKCGGILCQNQSNKILVGIGINLGQSETLPKSDEFKFGRSSLTNQKLSSDDIKEISNEIYSYIINNRLNEKEVRENWPNLCFHQNKKVKIIDDSFNISGTFKGIGSMGEALIETEDHQTKSLYSGSLFMD